MNKRIKKKKGISNKMRYYAAYYAVPVGADPYDYVDVFKAANDEEAVKYARKATDYYGYLISLEELNSKWISDFKRTVTVNPKAEIEDSFDPYRDASSDVYYDGTFRIVS